MDKDELIKLLIDALNKSKEDAEYWLYENCGKAPECLDSFEVVKSVLEKAKDMGY